MSFLDLKKEKNAVSELMREVTEFMEDSGATYQTFSKGNAEEIKKALPMWERSVLFKLRTGENLQNRILEMTEKEKRTEQRILLTDLLTVLKAEMKNLSGMRTALSDLRTASEAEKVISASEAVRKFKLAVEKDKNSMERKEGE